jgi:hypothetical protein
VSGPTFYVGAPDPGWLARTGAPLCVSHTRLAQRVALPRARGRWVLDSGGFTQLRRHGGWTQTAADYAAAVQRYRVGIGGLVWAAPQDWMYEPSQLARTGATIDQHQAATVANLVALRALAPQVWWLPVVQGWTRGSYTRCVARYAEAGIDLTRERLVGVGSVCRRSSAVSVALVIDELHAAGVRRLHGFGIKTAALRLVADQLTSADSQAWSAAARYEREPCPAGRRDCRNCLHWALEWGEQVTHQWQGHLEETLHPEPGRPR